MFVLVNGLSGVLCMQLRVVRPVRQRQARRQRRPQTRGPAHRHLGLADHADARGAGEMVVVMVVVVDNSVDDSYG